MGTPGPSYPTTPAHAPLHTLVNHLEEDGGRVVQVLLFGVPHEAGVFAGVAELQVTQQDGDVVHLLLSGALQGDAVIILRPHLGVRLLVLHNAVYELGQEKIRVVKSHSSLP